MNNLVGDVKANPRDFYRYINSQKKDTQGIPPLKKRQGSGLAQSDFEKASEFNGQFTDVFTKSEHSQVPLLDRSAPFREDIVVTKEGVTKLLKGLNPSKALGPDELYPRVLKELATELGPVFAHLFQQSIGKGEIPKEWSLANICPLFKKGDRSLACNYRPVSLTCVPCKLLEHIVCSNIMAHLDEHRLLSEKQHAFRKWHSCETQLITVIDDWAKILNNQGQVDTFILDFEKAFDTPPHELLKSKLFSYGIGGKTMKWIDAFLCFRQQGVVVNGVKSDWAPVVSGVPQGTVLGPLLFSLHINDIMSDIESEIRLFADDCVCYREIKDIEDTLKLQKHIDRLGVWARKWGMRFQPVKCNMMQLTNKHNKIQASYTLEGTVLKNVDSIKYLGVTITSDLKWNSHIRNVCSKANRTLGFLRRNLFSCPQDVKEAAYKSLVRPILEYGSTVWDPHYKEDKAMFEAICVSIGVPIVDVHSAFRLGNRQPTKIRPLKVIMMSKKQRKDVIDNAKFIGTKAPYPFRKVVIVKDLTPRQREENKQRRINKQHRNKQKSPAKINNEVQVHTNSSPMDQEGSSHRNAYSEETVLNTMVNNEETIIGGFSQDIDAAKLRALYPTEKGESPV